MRDDAIMHLTAAKVVDLTMENERLRKALLEAVMTINRSDPFFTVFMERYSDLLPIHWDKGPQAA